TLFPYTTLFRSEMDCWQLPHWPTPPTYMPSVHPKRSTWHGETSRFGERMTRYYAYQITHERAFISAAKPFMRLGSQHELCVDTNSVKLWKRFAEDLKALDGDRIERIVVGIIEADSVEEAFDEIRIGNWLGDGNSHFADWVEKLHDSGKE